MVITNKIDQKGILISYIIQGNRWRCAIRNKTLIDAVLRVVVPVADPIYASTNRLPDKSSIYSAELRALLLALELIEGSIKKHFIIFSDSLSAMQALKNTHPDHPLVGEILSWLTDITVHLELSIFFCWVPGHIGIPGNELVDDLAKLAVNLDSSEEPMFFKHLKPSINEHLTNIWQNRWSQSSPNKFLEIVPDLKNWKVPLTTADE